MNARTPQRITLAAAVARTVMAQAGAQTPEPPSAVVSENARNAVVTVDAGRVLHAVPKTLFGTFLEPIERSTYGGFWAQELENPGFEPNPWSPGRIRGMLESKPYLRRSSDMGLPLPWQPLHDDQAIRYEPHSGDAGVGVQALLVMALPSGETGVRQEVVLPVHRVLRYTGSLHARHVSGGRALEVSLRRRDKPEEVLCRQTVDVSGTKWSRYTFDLELPKDSLKRLETCDFVISLSKEARIIIDQAELFPADAIDGLDPDMVRLLKEMNSPLIRFGGNFTSGYHWKDGVGPREKRPTLINQSWGIPEYNHFGTDELLRLCELTGAQPLIALNLGSGTPQEAAAWVKYVNGRWADRKGGLLWELGNELWGVGWQIGYPTEERLAERTLAFSKAVRKVDPKARLIATGGDPEWAEGWNSRLLALPPGTFDYMATHFVDTPAQIVREDPDRDFVAQAAFALPVGIDRLLGRMGDQIASTPWKGKAGIAFTEWLFISPADRAPDFRNMGGSICVAGMLNTLMRRADVCPISTMTGIGYFHGMLKEKSQAYGTPSYWAFRMYTEAKPARLVAATVESETYDVREGNNRIPDIADVPFLDVTAALNETGDALTLFCVNRDLHRPAAALLKIGEFGSPLSAQVLAADTIYRTNSPEEPYAVWPSAIAIVRGQSGPQVTLPPASVAVITLRK